MIGNVAVRWAYQCFIGTWFVGVSFSLLAVWLPNSWLRNGSELSLPALEWAFALGAAGALVSSYSQLSRPISSRRKSAFHPAANDNSSLPPLDLPKDVPATHQHQQRELHARLPVQDANR